MPDIRSQICSPASGSDQPQRPRTRSLGHDQRGRAASRPLIWMLIVAAVVTAVWWYPSWRVWITPDTDSSAGPGRFPGGGAAAWRTGGGRPQPVSVGEVKQLDLRQTVSAIGTLTALNTAVVRAKVDGELKALRFTEGQMVTAGAVLADIDARAYEALLAQAKGQLERDAAQLRNAQLDLKRYRDLLSQDAIARQQVDTQEALVRQLQGTVQADQAQVDNAALQLSYTQVTAPISGRLGLKQVELGSLVRAGDVAGLVTITQTQPMAVLFAVPEAHVPLIQRKLRGGQSLAVQAWDRDLKEKLAEGQVMTTDNAIDLNTGTLKLKALLDNREGLLFPNQFANIRLQLDTLKEQLAVPATAVQRGSVGTFVVVVQADGTAKIRAVELGAVDGEWQAVKGTLQAGERVVTDGADRLRDGSRVEVRNTVTPPLPSQSPMLGGTPGASPGAKSGPQRSKADPAGSSPPQSSARDAAQPGSSTASGTAGPGASASSASGGAAGPGGSGGPGGPGASGGRPPWMDRLPPEVADKVKNMSPEERRAFFQKMREQRGGGGP
jgi:multidrug efflux system membrane fusion protein